MSGRDRLDLIALLAHIADTRSLSEAADRAGMSQPSASRLLKQLEELVQAKLVERSTRELAMTPAGSRFVAATRGLTTAWAHAVEDLHRERDVLAGHLRVVAPVVAGQELMASIVARFLKQNPGVTIEWRLSDAPVDPTPEADLWIRIGDLPTERLVVREVWHIGCAVIGGPAHLLPICPKDLEGTSAVRIVTCVPERVELTSGEGKRFELRQTTAFAVDNLFAARAALREGVGFGIMPLWAVHADLRNGALVHLCPDWTPPSVVLSLAYPPSNNRPKRLAALLDFMKTELTHTGGRGLEFIEAADAHASIVTATA